MNSDLFDKNSAVIVPTEFLGVSRQLTFDSHLCNGCGDCAAACLDQLRVRTSSECESIARVHVLGRSPVFWLAVCRQCAEAPCADACITGALQRNGTSQEVELNEHACIGCGMCVMVCPFGSIWLDSHKGRSVKCDLCPTRGTLPCVAACRPGALRADSPFKFASDRRRRTTVAKLTPDRKLELASIPSGRAAGVTQ